MLVVMQCDYALFDLSLINITKFSEGPKGFDVHW